LLGVIAGACALLGAPSTASADPPTNTRDEIACRASSGVGYSYYWGGGCWCQSGCSPNFGACSAGSCSGSCPSCSHSGTYGADCSGFVNKVWQVPSAIATNSCGHGNYVAASYTSSTSYWSVIDRSALQKGDVLASSSHVAVYDQGDPWGSMAVWEAKGCSYGIVHNWRTFSSSYSAARRINIDETSNCECDPGETETEACGDCGYRQRTCQTSCEWGAWSGCQGEGPCSPGASESRACNQCGVENRSCNSSCQWGAWGICLDVDPDAGNDTCDTLEPGPCAAGRLNCNDGALDCVREYEPSPELCDDFDNDCSGEADDGFPTTMGVTPPKYAAALRDYQVPAHVVAGQTAQVWATFDNVGTDWWPRGQLRLTAMSAVNGMPSDIYSDESWPDWDVAAVLDYDVAPGDNARYEFRFTVPENAPSQIIEEFRLTDPEGALLACPSPSLTVEIWVDQADQADQPGSVDTNVVVGGCRVNGARRRTSGPSAWLILVLLAGSVVYRRRRARAGGRRPRPARRADCAAR